MTIEQNLETKYFEFLANHKDILLNEWKKLDDKLLKLKSKDWVAKDFKERTLWDPHLGLFVFKRRRYINKVTKKHKFLLDEHLGLPKNKLIMPAHRELAVFYYQVFKSYKEIAYNVYQGEVSKMSIHRFIKESNPEFLMQNYTCTNDGILWINADGCWLKQHKSKKNVEVKNFVFYTGRSLGRWNKWHLDGRTLKQFIDEDDNEMVEQLDRIIDQYQDVREIRLIGDGAQWIKRVAKQIGATYYIDKFHIRKALKDLVGKSKYSQGLELISQEWNSIKNLKLEMLKLMSNDKTGEVDIRNIKLLGYIINNHKHYIKSVSDNTTNGIEALQAHFQCRYLKNQRKGFSLPVLNKLMTTFYNFANKGWEFTNFKKSYCNFDVGHRKSGKNVPVLEYGLSSTGTYRSLQYIINS